MPHLARTRALVLSRPAVVATLAVAFALILGTALLTALATRGVTRADDHAAHAQQTLATTNQFLATLAEAGREASRAIATPDAPALAAYAEARARHAREAAALRAHVERHAEMQPIADQVEALANGRMAALDQAVAQRNREAAATAPASADLEEIRRLIAALQRHEFAELAQYSADAATRAETIQALNLGLIVVAGALATGVAWWLLRRMRELEGLITVCAWTQRVQWKGRWISFEEYLALRFNLHCTHGICDEAAAQMRAEALKTFPDADPLPPKRPPVEAPLASAHSTAPFA